MEKTRFIKIILAGSLVFWLASCAPDPRKEAIAQVTILQAEQDAADREQARGIKQDAAEVEKARSEWTAEVWDSTKETAKERANTLVYFVGWSLTISLTLAVLAFGWTLKETSIGVGRAFVKFTQLRAGLIHMDQATRTFPLLQHIHGTRYLLTNPNTDGVLRLDIKNPSDRQMIATLGLTSAIGALAQEARQSQDPTGMAMINPPIVTAPTLQIGEGRKESKG